METTILWNFLAAITIISALYVIGSNNPMHSIFYLVLVFASASLSLILLGIEFLSLLLIIVYVGAIAILFLFVVMMLNIRLVEFLENSSRYIPIGFLVGMVFIGVMYKEVRKNISEINSTYLDSLTNFSDYSNTTNIAQLGEILYTEYWMYFILAGMILFVAMIGAIILSLSHEKVIKRQDIFSQTSTDPDFTVRFKS